MPDGDSGKSAADQLELRRILSSSAARGRRSADTPLGLGFEAALVGMAMTDMDGRFTTVNAALCSLLGKSAGQLLGTTLSDVVAVADREVAKQITQAARSERSDATLELVGGAGEPVWTDVTAILISEAGSEPFWFLQVADVTDRKLLEQQLERLTLHDTLTDLPNRRMLMERLHRAIIRARETGGEVAVTVLGVDRFKMINNGLGHAAGDALLIQLANRLRHTIPDTLIARFVGDQFVVVSEDVLGTADAEAQAAQLLAIAAARFDVSGSVVFATVSAGITMWDPTASAESLVRDAEVAMFRAKGNGGGHSVTFDGQGLTEVREQLTLETDLRSALTRHEIAAYYQPIIRMDDNQVVGAEALARWDHPVRGPISPEVFVPLAESIGIRKELTLQILVTACVLTAGWQAQGLVGPRVSCGGQPLGR